MIITPELLAALAGAGLSLVFAYVPGVRDWFARLQPDQRRAVMGLAIIVAAIGALGASCVSLYNAVTCDKDGALILMQCVVSALVANQSVFTLAVKGRVA